ncbi:MAG: LysM peptidoglycan-binding domain-containing protein [Spirochaetales bacterium]
MQRTRNTYSNSIVNGVICGVLFLTVVTFAAGDEQDSDDEWADYTFRPGDTVYSLSRDYGISPDDILEYNGITDAGRIAEGETIVLPGVREIQSGETLYGLSRRYDVPLSELLSANEMDEDETVFVGDRVVIPGITIEQNSESASADAEEDEAADDDDRERSNGGDGDNSDSDLRWPHDGSRSDRSGRVPGVSIRASEGDSVRAVADGRVTFVGPYAGFGTVVIVEAVNGYIYVYGGHEEVEVRVGRQIKRGEVLGTVGTVDSRHEVHFSVWNDDAPVDPQDAPRG